MFTPLKISPVRDRTETQASAISHGVSRQEASDATPKEGESLTGFAKRPAFRLRLDIQSVVAEFRGGIHESIMSGLGLEFKGLRPYDTSDSPSVIDDFASARVSEESEFEPLSRDYHPERKISVFVAVDGNRSMAIPSRKFEYASVLLWLFALSALDPESRDLFRILFFWSDNVVDSGFISAEESIEEFLAAWKKGTLGGYGLTKTSDFFSYLGSLEIHDTLVAVVSDFSSGWERELDQLRRLPLFENNIRMIFFALDAWKGFVPQGSGVLLHDPVGGVYRQFCMREGSGLDLMSKEAEKHLSNIEKRVRPLGISFVRLGLIDDSIAAVRKELLRFGFE